uniref:Ig-like domain-containing protein n=1 Tax=uncultured Massilia sp. TaxID=169973 RepID=UPI0025EDF065
NSTTPQFTGTGTSGDTVTLYDTDGTTVLGSAVVNGGKWSITSSTLDDGAHTLTVKQANVAGTSSAASTAVTFTIDTSVPAAPSTPAMTAGTDTGLSSSDGVTSNTTPVFTGTGEIGATVTLYDTNGSTVLGNATVDGSGKWSITSSTLSQGMHQVTAKQVDAAGNASAAGGALFVEIDTTAPDAPDAPALSAGSDSGVAGDLLTNVATPVVTGMAEGNAKVRLYDTDGTTLLGTTTADGTGKWSITSSTLSSGSHTLTVKQTDLAGNVSKASTGLTLEIDTSTPAAPGAPVLAAASDSGAAGDDRTNVSTPQFTGTGTSGDTVKLYDTDGTTVLGSAVVDGGGKWSITSTALADGPHTLTVKQSNAAGTSSAASTGLAVTIDTSVPATLSAPVLAPASDSGAAGDGITNATKPVFTGTGVSGNLVTVYDTDGVTVLGSGTVDGDGNWRVTSSALAEGMHAISATQTNAAGTVSLASSAYSVTVDATAPANLKLSNGSVFNTGAANALVGSLSATDAVTLGYALVAGSGDTGNASFNIDGGNLRLSNPAQTPAGSYSVRVQVTDAAGNSYQQVLSVVVVEPTSTQVSTVDGVQVQVTPVALPGGGTGTAVVVPVIGADRTDTDAASSNADIPLVGAGTGAALVAHVPVGVGLQSSGGAGQQAGTAQDVLVGAILARTADNTAQDQAHLTGNGKGFLAQLPASQQLLVNTVVVEGGGAAPLVLSGAGGTQQTALVIDTTGAANGQVTLENVSFAALVGKGTLSGATDGQVLSGDAAAQHFVVGGVTTSTVHSGGGDDVLELTAAAASTGTAIPGGRADTASPRALLLDGGTGADTVQLGRNQADYTVARSDGHVVVTDKVSGVVATLVNVEAIHFADATLQLDSRAELGTLAALYQHVLGRQADVAGFEFWGANQGGHAASLGEIAVGILGSAESVARGNVLDGNAGHDVGLLYQALFGRAADAAGAAFWTDAMAHGATLAQVADGMLASAETAAHTLDATNWNLFF